MDKLDLMNAFEIVEHVKDVLEKSSYNYRIIREEGSEDSLLIVWQSENGDDGLPMYECQEFLDRTFKGEYQLKVDIQKNLINFWYVPAGTFQGILTSCKVGINESGKPIFREINNLIAVKSIEKEWNDNFQKYLLVLHSYAYKDGDNAYLAFEYNCCWDFNENDTIDGFKNEFQKSMNTCQSKEMADFIINKIFMFMDSNKKL